MRLPVLNSLRVSPDQLAPSIGAGFFARFEPLDVVNKPSPDAVLFFGNSPNGRALNTLTMLRESLRRP